MEKDLRKCKTCGEMKERILVGSFNHKDKKYTDSSGSFWHGSVCPSCNLIRVQQTMQRSRKNDKG